MATAIKPNFMKRLNDKDVQQLVVESMACCRTAEINIHFGIPLIFYSGFFCRRQDMRQSDSFDMLVGVA